MNNIVILDSRLVQDFKSSKRFSDNQKKNIRAKLKNFRYISPSFGNKLKENIRYFSSETHDDVCTIFYFYISTNVIQILDVINAIDLSLIKKKESEMVKRRNELLKYPHKNKSKILHK